MVSVVDLVDKDLPVPQEVVSSYIELKINEATTFLSLSIPRSVVAKLGEAIGLAGGELSEEEMGQDISGEITNIIGHSVQTYFRDMPGIDVTVGLPQVGIPDPVLPRVGCFSLRSVNKDGTTLHLDFVYSEPF